MLGFETEEDWFEYRLLHDPRFQQRIAKSRAQYEAGKELVPGITAVASYGHTLGHTSHVVASGNRKLLVQADITAGAASLFVRNPDWQFIWDADRAMAVESRKRLYDMAIAERMLVHDYHFPFPALGNVEKAGSGYRFVPAPWNPNI